MVNKLCLFLSILSFVIITECSFADEGDFGIGADVGGVGLVGNGTSVYGKNGFGFGGYLTYAPSELFDLDLNLVYSPHKSNGNTSNVLYGTLALKFGMTFDQLQPFLTGGVGFYRNSLKLANGVADTEGGFGFNMGGGMDVDLGKYLRLGLLVRYHPVFGTNDYWDALLRIGFLFRTGVQGGWD